MTTPPEMARDLTSAVLKASPPATVWALTLNEWVAVATVVYILLQAGYLLWKWYREWKHAQRNRAMVAQAKRDADA